MPLFQPPPIEFFSAIPSGAQSGVVSGTPTQVLFGTAQSNVGGRYATGTSLATLPPGRPWLLSAGVFISSGLTAAARLSLTLLTNDVSGRLLADVITPASGGIWVGGSIVVNPNGATYGVAVTGYAGAPFSLYNGGEATFFTGTAL